jgi:hypothetical protein
MANLIRLSVPKPSFSKILFNAYPLLNLQQRESLTPTLNRCSRFATAIDKTGSIILPSLMDSVGCSVSRFEEMVSVDYEGDDDSGIYSHFQRALLRASTWSTHVDVVDDNRKVSERQVLRGDDDNTEFDGFATQPCTHDLQFDSQSEDLTVPNRLHSYFHR